MHWLKRGKKLRRRKRLGVAKSIIIVLSIAGVLTAVYLYGDIVNDRFNGEFQPVVKRIN